MTARRSAIGGVVLAMACLASAWAAAADFEVIRSLVPEFSILRANGVVYDSKFSGFSFIKPGDSQKREVRFNGIDCDGIDRVKVGGGDRCEMGDLDKFSNAKGACLSHVRVEPSSVMRFEK